MTACTTAPPSAFISLIPANNDGMPCAMVRWIAILAMTATFSSAENTSTLISLEQAIDKALSENRSIAALELDLNGRALNAEQARYRFAFNLSPVAGAVARSSSDTFRYGLVGSQQMPVGTEIEIGARAEQTDTDTADAMRLGNTHLQVRQPLFRDWGLLINREGIEQADSRTVAGRRLLELRKQDIVLQVVETSQGMLRLQRLMVDEQYSIDRYERLLRLTKAKEKQGRATQVDRLRIEILKGQAEARKANSFEQLRSLQADFSNLLGAAPDLFFLPEEREDMRLATPLRNDAVGIAFQQRLDYAQALHDLSDSQRGIRVAKKAAQPAFSLIGRYERYGTGPDWNDAWALDEEFWAVGISADSDLLMRDERLGIRRAALDEKSAALRVEETEALIRRQIDQALSACRRAESDQDIAERNMELASQRANLAQRLFEKGKIDHTSATDAEIELLEARTQWLNARAEAVIAGYRLLRMMGLLLETPEELKPSTAPHHES